MPVRTPIELPLSLETMRAGKQRLHFDMQRRTRESSLESWLSGGVGHVLASGQVAI